MVLAPNGALGDSSIREMSAFASRLIKVWQSGKHSALVINKNISPEGDLKGYFRPVSTGFRAARTQPGTPPHCEDASLSAGRNLSRSGRGPATGVRQAARRADETGLFALALPSGRELRGEFSLTTSLQADHAEQGHHEAGNARACDRAGDRLIAADVAGAIGARAIRRHC
jgi:hypothetical protein